MTLDYKHYLKHKVYLRCLQITFLGLQHQSTVKAFQHMSPEKNTNFSTLQQNHIVEYPIDVGCYIG